VLLTGPALVCNQQWGMAPSQVSPLYHGSTPSGMSLLWRDSSCGSTSLSSTRALAWQGLWRHLPQKCPCSGMAAAVAGLPSGVSLLWHGSGLGGTSLRRVPALVALPSEGNHSFCAESAQLNGCSLLQYGAPYTSLVSNFGIYWGFFLLVLSATGPAGSHSNCYVAVHGHPVTSHLWQPCQIHLRPNP